MKLETVRLETDARGVARLTLDRPDKRNALSPRMIDELAELCGEIAPDSEIRVVVLEGRGEVFCAGGDLDWMRAQFEADRAGRMREATRLAAMLSALNELAKPVVARVQGGAYGGGVGLLSVCDAAVADEDARFGLTEARLGLIPATISPYVVARIGEGAARRLFASARLFGAEEARSLGLVSRVAPADRLDAALEAELAPFLAAAPGAAARAKALARSLGPRIDEDVIAATAERLADAWEDPEAREGVAAFFDRRAPRWRA